MRREILHTSTYIYTCRLGLSFGHGWIVYIPKTNLCTWAPHSMPLFLSRTSPHHFVLLIFPSQKGSFPPPHSYFSHLKENKLKQKHPLATLNFSSSLCCKTPLKEVLSCLYHSPIPLLPLILHLSMYFILFLYLKKRNIKKKKWSVKCGSSYLSFLQKIINLNKMISKCLFFPLKSWNLKIITTNYTY